MSDSGDDELGQSSVDDGHASGDDPPGEHECEPGIVEEALAESPPADDDDDDDGAPLKLDADMIELQHGPWSQCWLLANKLTHEQAEVPGAIGRSVVTLHTADEEDDLPGLPFVEIALEGEEEFESK